LLGIYETAALKNEETLSKSQGIQMESNLLQKKRTSIAEKQMETLQTAVRMEGMSTWMGKINQLTKEYKVLKKSRSHCENSSDDEKQNFCELQKEETTLIATPLKARTPKPHCWMTWNKSRRSSSLPRMS
jgi:hypothetical protein